MLNPRSCVLCVVIGGLLAIAFDRAVSPVVAPALASDKPYRIAGAVKDESGEWVALEVQQQTRGKVSFRIRYVDPDAARRAIQSSLGREVDLLPGSSGERQPGYRVFALEVTNGSQEDVLFNPAQARLTTEKGDMKFALDYTALYEASRRLGPGAPELDELATVLFDRSVNIRAGGSVRKLLAFDAPREDRYRTLEVRLAELNIGASGVDVVFAFRKFFDE